MKQKTTIRSYIFGMILFLMILSGFAQMPIFKRYYIADIPGLGWLADFYVTHLIHYGLSIILIGWGVYAMMHILIFKPRVQPVPLSSMIGSIIFSGLILTGVLLVFKNFPGTPFPFGFIIILNLLHLFFCMSLLVFGLYRIIQQKKLSYSVAAIKK